jgi:hypothetical protein
MSEQPQSAWFYSRDGERIGPVAFAELRAKAMNSELRPRTDMVWTQGMAEWKPAGEIDGLFGKPGDSGDQKSLAPPTERYVPPKGESVEDVMLREGGWGGARRRSFLFAAVFFPVFWHAALPIAASMLTRELGPEIVYYLVFIGSFLPPVVAIYVGILRLVNLGMSRWWILAHFVPGLNLWLGYRTCACPAGYAWHKKLDGIGVFLSIVYWLLVLIGLLALAAFVAMMAGALGGPEMRDHAFEIIRVVREKILIP